MKAASCALSQHIRAVDHRHCGTYGTLRHSHYTACVRSIISSLMSVCLSVCEQVIVSLRQL